MKKTDIAMIVFIAGIGVLIAYFIAINLSFLKLPEEGLPVQSVEALSAEVKTPNKDIFNSDAINPTVEIVVGGSSAD